MVRDIQLLESPILTTPAQSDMDDKISEAERAIRDPLGLG